LKPHSRDGSSSIASCAVIGAAHRLARILVLDGHSSAALAFTRSAGLAGHWVAVGANQGQFAAARLSRYCKLSFEYPVSTENADAFVGSVLEFARRNSIDLIVPVADWTLQPLSEHRDRFQDVCRVALPPHQAVLTTADKFRTVEIAKNIGIAVPRTCLIRSNSDIDRHCDLNFPVVIKDRFSVRWSGQRAVFGSVVYAFSEEEFGRLVSQRLQGAGDVLVQEFVVGVGIGMSFFVTKNGARLPFMWERVREVDPRGSASSCRKSIPLDRSLADSSSRLIQEIGFEGIAMVEYKKDVEGRAVLMEINGRPWGSIALPIESGIDYPKYLIDWWLTGAEPPQEISYRPQITCRRLVGELTHLSNVRKGVPPNWPTRYPSFWSSLVNVAIPWYPGMRYDDVWLSDPQPGLAQIAEWFRVRRKG
jgi:predicted ATP-grasp superfamily ATP-dependent carboligase